MQVLYKILDRLGYYDKRKALIVPINSDGKILIQDRSGHKPPPWGFFGGGIEKAETSLQAVIREVKEELDISLIKNDLKYIGIFPTKFDDIKVIRYMYLYKTDQKEFNVLEGAGAHWLSVDEARDKLHSVDQLDKIIKRINQL